MNKIIKTLAAFSLLAFAAACSKEVSSTPAGEEVTVTFSVTSPELQTKAVSDGNTVDKVKCAAYDADGNLLAISAVETPVEMTGGKATWAVSLVSGQTYSFAFWAYSSKQEAYAFDAESATVTVDYSKAAANDDTFDAFYAYKADFTVNGAFTETVTLTRPFAQLNLGASDLAKAKEAGFELATAAVKATGVATSLNLKDGSVSGSADVAFAAASAPLANETLTVSGTEYDYVSMAYLLVGKDQALTNVTYTLASAAGKSIDVSVPNAPLKANYRTNVVGDLFTTDGELKIELKPGYDGDQEAKPAEVISTNEQLLKVLTEASAGEVLNITLGEGTFSTYKTTVSSGKTIVYTGQGAGKTIFACGTDPSITGSEYGADYSLDGADVTFKDLTVSTLEEKSTNYRGFIRATNLTFENCVFKEMLSYLGEGNVTFKNCTFTQTESGWYNLWTYSGKTFVFENCTFNSSDGRFINVYQEADNEITKVTVRDCSFVGGTVNKSALEVKGMNNLYSVYFEGTNTTKNCKKGATSGSELYQCQDGKTTMDVYIDNKLVWTNGAKVE